jgi:hypothetical protein
MPQLRNDLHSAGRRFDTLLTKYRGHLLHAEMRNECPCSGLQGAETRREDKFVTSIERREDGGRLRYVARYRDPSGKQRNKTFTRKVDAERYLTSVESAKLSGQYVDPARSRVTVGSWADLWLDAQTDLAPKTRERYEGILSRHIRPGVSRSPR